MNSQINVKVLILQHPNPNAQRIDVWWETLVTQQLYKNVLDFSMTMMTVEFFNSCL